MSLKSKFVNTVLKYLFTSTLIIFFKPLIFSQPSCIIAKYNFNGNANDSSGNGNHLNAVNVTLTKDRFGNANSAYHFNGNAYLTATVGSNFSPDEFSIAFWMNPDTMSLSNTPRIIAVGPPYSYYHYYSNIIQTTSVTGLFGTDGIGSTSFETYIPSKYVPKKWVHIVSSYRNDTIRIYLDGSLKVQAKAAKSVTKFTTNQSLQIGGMIKSTNITGIKGDMDDVIFYCKALSEDQITQLYKGCSIFVTTDPKDQSLKVGETANFEISSSDSFTSYKWQYKKGSSYVDINGGQFSGHKTANLKVSNASPIGNNNQLFRCIVFNVYKGGCSDTSKPATLKVICGPLINKQPSDINMKVGDEAKFYLSKKYNNSSIIWQTKGISGFEDIVNNGRSFVDNEDTLHITKVLKAENNKNFRGIVSYLGCKDTSDIVTLTADCKPIINKQPINDSVKAGANVIFEINTFDTSAKYQWQVKKDSNYINIVEDSQYGGSSSSSLKVNGVKASNNNQLFICIASLYGCTDTSDEVTIKVTCDTLLKLPPKDLTLIEDSDAEFTLSSFSSNVQYKWQTDLGFGFKEIIDSGQYYGSHNDTLKVSNIKFHNNKQNFKCLLRDQNECEEISNVVTLNIICKPLILSHPKDVSAKVGINIMFVVKSSNPNTTYQWQNKIGTGFYNLSNSGQFSGVNNDTLKITSLGMANDSQIYRCVIESINCIDTSIVANIHIEKNQININEMIKEKIHIYPNPIQGYINIIYPYNSKTEQYEISDQYGRIYYSGYLKSNPLPIDVKGLSPGIYFLIIKTTKKNVFKLMVN